MSPVLSVYLDACRFFSAIVVFLSHLSGQRFTGGIFWQFGPYGNQAVTVFFVLSGFVIAYVAFERHNTARSYAVARFARVYSVAAPTLLVTFILDQIGQSVNPGMYTSEWGFAGDKQLLRYLTAMTFTGRVWWAGLSVGSNLPYWSLQYEVWYYFMFGIILFVPRQIRWPCLIIASVAAGPPIMVLFPLWLMGVATYFIIKRSTISRRQGIMLAVVSVLFWLLNEVLKSIFGQILIGEMFSRKMLFDDYVVATLFSAHIVGVHGATRRWSPADGKLFQLVRWLAGGSFSIYLLHLPIGQFLASITPWPATTTATRVFVLGVVSQCVV